MQNEPHPANELKLRPLVATMEMSGEAQSYFNQLRQQHFPAERNYLDAHLTLFHAIPDESRLIEELTEIIKDHNPFEVTAQNIVSLGNGTAFKIHSAELAVLHQTLRKRWFDSLTPQDRQKRNFHITIQNKVQSQAAKTLQAELASTFEPFNFPVTGIQLWRYLGGPWEYLMTMPFAGDLY